MKVKEKLAEEWVHSERLGYYGCESDFIAGFEKAREMAAKLHEDNLAPGGKRHGMCDYCSHEGEHHFDDDCKILGEEEA